MLAALCPLRCGSIDCFRVVVSRRVAAAGALCPACISHVCSRCDLGCDVLLTKCRSCRRPGDVVVEQRAHRAAVVRGAQRDAPPLAHDLHKVLRKVCIALLHGVPFPALMCLCLRSALRSCSVCRILPSLALALLAHRCCTQPVGHHQRERVALHAGSLSRRRRRGTFAHHASLCSCCSWCPRIALQCRRANP